MCREAHLVTFASLFLFGLPISKPETRDWWKMFIEEVILGHTWRGWGRDSSGVVGGTEGQVREHLLPEKLRFCLQGGECRLLSRILRTVLSRRRKPGYSSSSFHLLWGQG